MPYLDDSRVLFAAERTLPAWQRSAIALMAFGFVVERFGLFLRMVNNQPLTLSQRGFSLWLGVGLLVVSALVSITASLQYQRVIRSLGSREIPDACWTNLGVWLNFLLAFISLAPAAHFVWSDRVGTALRATWHCLNVMQKRLVLQRKISVPRHTSRKHHETERPQSTIQMGRRFPS